MTNWVFDKLTVIERVEDYVSPHGRHESQWLCKCECGYFKNKEDAIKARKEAEEKYFGEYSYDNSQKQWKENFCEEQNLS